MRIKIVWVGKTRSPQINALAADYLARLRHLVPCEILEARDPGRGRNLKGDDLRAAEAEQLLKLTEGFRRIVVLDERGRQFSSPEFAHWLEGEQNRGTREIAFVIGGPEGISPAVSEHATLNLSLGRMTWTHEICRALLLEQIYRAFSILKKIPYHK
jgi:23S rRNA (pseudouridine1915-N3)-methyltransferase